MLKLLQKKPRSFLGIDITPNTIKMLQLSGQPDSYCIEHYEQIHWAANQHDAENDIDSLAQSIQVLHEKGQFSARDLILAVPDRVVLNKKVSVSRSLNESELEEWVALEVSKFSPYSLNELYLDFSICGVSTRNPALIDVLIVAAPSVAICSRVQAIEQAGLNARIVEPESFAAVRALYYLGQQALFESHQCVAVFNLTLNACFFWVFEYGQMLFAQEQLISSIQPLEPFQIVHQLKQLLQTYYSSQSLPIDALILAGDQKNPRLQILIQEELKLNPLIFNPCENLSIHQRIDKEALQQHAPALLVALGLALRSELPHAPIG